MNSSDVVRALVDVATGKIPHLFRGSCPDGIEGPDARDPECPACHAIDVALTQPAASGEVVGYATPDGLAELAADRCSATMFGNYSERYGRTVPLYASPQPSEDTARDAARYRWLLAKGKPAAEGLLMRDPSKWSAAIDSAIKGEK